MAPTLNTFLFGDCRIATATPGRSKYAHTFGGPHDRKGTSRDFDEALSSPFTQGKPNTPCLNPKCSNRKKRGQLIPIALMPAEPVQDVHTFGRWGGGVQLIFRMCPKCYTIRVSNQCD